LTLSLDVICDVIYYLHYIAVKLAMSVVKQIRVWSTTMRCINYYFFPPMYQDKKFSKEVFRHGCLHDVVCMSTSDWLNRFTVYMTWSVSAHLIG